MKLSKFKDILETCEEVIFQLPDGELVPSHYHVTEVGMINKHFIDCGGTVRKEHAVNFQLWYSDDENHRLKPNKLMSIIKLSEEKLAIEDFEIEVEYQSDTIGKYGLDFIDGKFKLTTKMTDCLAPEKCNIPVVKKKINLGDLMAAPQSCEPGGGCC